MQDWSAWGLAGLVTAMYSKQDFEPRNDFFDWATGRRHRRVCTEVCRGTIVTSQLGSLPRIKLLCCLGLNAFAEGCGALHTGAWACEASLLHLAQRSCRWLQT